MRKNLSLLFLIFISSLSAFSYPPATEIRAAWLTTNWGLDWPTIGASEAVQKEELRRLLDELQADNFNVVLFQARAQGRVFYNSRIEPKSPYYDHSGNFDPLAFAIEECHARGMECHAWLVTYPVEKVEMRTIWKGKTSQLIPVTDNKPGYYKIVGDRWYLDPGSPETHERILSIVREVVANYNVDGIHFDYIRYPDDPRTFQDHDTYLKYGNGKSLEEWRRDNITQMVSDIYDNVKAIKKWVQVSSSPLGRYRALPGIMKHAGWTAYDAVYQDAGEWMRMGKQDLLFPMMYHKQNFYSFLQDWLANSYGRYIVPGLGIFQMMENQGFNWSLQTIVNQMDYTRLSNTPGQAYFRSKNIVNNLKGIRNSIQSYYITPAKLPPLTWLSDEKPIPPKNTKVFVDKDGLINVVWEAPDNGDYTYNVYISKTRNVNINNAYNILATGVRGDGIMFEPLKGDTDLYYFVTVSDRYHNESIVCAPTTVGYPGMFLSENIN